MLVRLSSEEIGEHLKELSGWSSDGRNIKRRLEFEEFRGAIQFMQLCVDGIEERNHHPVWINKFNVIDIQLNTFDIGGYITLLDFDLAKFFESMLREYRSHVGYISS